MCDLKGVGEDQLKEILVRMFNRLYTEKDSFIGTMVNNISKVIGADRTIYTEEYARLSHV